MRNFLSNLTLLCLFAADATASDYPFYRFELPESSLAIIQKFLPEDPVIIDAGAFDGKESVVMSKLWPNGTIHSFEPVPYLYKILLRNTKSAPNIYAYNFALSSTNGMAEMHLSVNDNAPNIPVMSSSLLPPKDHFLFSPEVIFPTVIPVYTYNLDSWAKAFDIDRIDLMWLDMQGVELNVLKSCPDILNTTSVILTEVEFTEAYDGQYLYQDVRDFLEEQGFVLIGGNFNPENPRENGSFFGDALFIRFELLLPKW